jgi:hypothetical protein
MISDHMVTLNLDMPRGKIVSADVNTHESDGSVRKLIYG